MEMENELNAFLRSHRVVSVSKEYESSYWLFCVEYLVPSGAGFGGGQKSRVDYKDSLTEEEFAIYVQLREARRVMAEEAGVPVYIIATNEQLGSWVRSKSVTLADLQRVHGFGENKCAKYGEVFLEILRKAFANEAGG